MLLRASRRDPDRVLVRSLSLKRRFRRSAGKLTSKSPASGRFDRGSILSQSVGNLDPNRLLTAPSRASEPEVRPLHRRADSKNSTRPIEPSSPERPPGPRSHRPFPPRGGPRRSKGFPPCPSGRHTPPMPGWPARPPPSTGRAFPRAGPQAVDADAASPPGSTAPVPP